MSEDEKRARAERHFKILFRVGGELLTAFRPQEPLCLGLPFSLRTKRLFDELEQRRSAILGELQAYSWADLERSFTESGSAIGDEAKDWLAKLRTEHQARYGRLSPWYLAPFTFGDLADYDYWSKSAFLRLDEALFLSVGLQPHKKFMDKLSSRVDDREDAKDVTEFLAAKRELFRREFDPHNFRSPLQPVAILDWVKRVDLETHPGFRRMLETMARRSDAQPGSVDRTEPKNVPDGRFDSRERESMAKIITAIAIDAYGYDPTSKRSPIPQEIEGIAVRAGIDISHDTIRKFLQMGAKYLPADWKPDS